MNKKISLLLLVSLLVVVFAFCATAADTTVYVRAGAAGDGTTAETPCGSLQTAVTALDGKGGTVQILGTLTQSADITIPEQSGDLTFTGGTLVLQGADILLAKNENDNTVTFDMALTASGNAAILGGFNSVHFTENFVVVGDLAFFGGAETPEGSDSGTAQSALFMIENRKAITELPYTITVDGGKFATFVGGNRRSTYTSILGSIAAPLDIVINGGTFGGGVSFTADSAIKNEQAFSLSGMSILASDASLTINGGTFDLPIYAQGYIGETCTRTSGSSPVVMSDAKYYAVDGDIEITLCGGTFNGCEINAFQNAASYTQLLRGNYTLTVSGDATLADGIVLDATQVKGYAGSESKATLVYPAGANVTVKRFDIVNGAAQTYDEPIRFACIGDSITQGTGNTSNGHGGTYAETMSYPAQLLTQMTAAGKDVILGNYGCGGTRVLNYGNLWYNDMLAYVLSTREADPDYVIIGLGTNDAHSTTYCHGQVDHFYTGYTELIRDYGTLPSVKTVYGTNPLHRTDKNASGLGAVANVAAMQKLALNTQNAADNGKYQFVDLYALTLADALDGKLLSGDQLHPNAAGYTIYADKIYNAVFNKVYAPAGFYLDDVYLSESGKPAGAGTAADPISLLPVALGRMAENATLHIVGEYNYANHDSANYTTTFPAGVKLNIVGEGTGAKFTTNAKYLTFQNATTVSNITFGTSASGALYIECGYNDVTLADTFDTDNGVFLAGWVTVGENPASGWYNRVEGISTDKDCTITVNGGSYQIFLGGNYLFINYKAAIYGTYSGNMTLNIGKDAVIKDNIRNGICGQNYLTGSITANIDSWNGTTIRDFGWKGNATASETYNEGNNTGSITVNKGEGVTAELIVAGDFDGDGDKDLADALMLLGYMLNGFDNTKWARFYGGNTAATYPTVSLVNVVRALKALAG